MPGRGKRIPAAVAAASRLLGVTFATARVEWRGEAAEVTAEVLPPNTSAGVKDLLQAMETVTEVGGQWNMV